MPGAVAIHQRSGSDDLDVARSRLSKPLAYTGLLDSYSRNDLTPTIGTEYEGLQIVDLLAAKNSDAIIRDLAVTVSQRGVLFLRNQDVTPVQMRELMERISQLAGCVRCTCHAQKTLLIHLTAARIVRPPHSSAYGGGQRTGRPDQRH